LVALLLLPLLSCDDRVDSGTGPLDDTEGSSNDTATTDETGTTVDSGTTTDPDPRTIYPGFPDADGDGWPAQDDCDDNQPYTHPGGEEWCDTVDHDCDGEPLAEGVCGKTQKIEAIEAPWIDGDLYEDFVYGGVFAGDLDGDPGEELLAQTWHSYDDGVSAYGAVAVVSRLPDAPGTSITDLADHIFTRSWGGFGEWQGVDDFNGDGHDDFIVIEGAAGVAGVIDLFLGPSSDWPAVAFMYDAASVVWEDPDPDKTESIGDFVDGQGDVNGDGYSEILVEAHNDDYQNVLIMGRAETPAGGETLLEETLNTTRDGRDYAIGPDLDGDGTNDILGLYAGFHYLPGASIQPGASSVWEELGSWVAYDIYGGDNCQLSADYDDALLAAGDFTGDGVEDLGFHCDEDLGTASGTEPTLYLIDGAALAAADPGFGLMDLAHGPWLMTPDEIDKGGTALPLADVDKDGQGDLWFRACGNRSDATGCRIYLLQSTLGVPGPYTDPRDVGYALSLTDEFVTADSQAYITSSGDIDGDTFPELAFSHHYDIGYDQDGVYSTQSALRIVPGWDIPWDDPFYW